MMILPVIDFEAPIEDKVDIHVRHGNTQVNDGYN
jgi:hypothetical protein